MAYDPRGVGASRGVFCAAALCRGGTLQRFRGTRFPRRSSLRDRRSYWRRFPLGPRRHVIDVIIVGSGPGGANAAVPLLVEKGLKVVLLDVGEEDTRYAKLIPPESFRSIRGERYAAARPMWPSADNWSGIPFGKVGLGAQLTPSRQYDEPRRAKCRRNCRRQSCGSGEFGRRAGLARWRQVFSPFSGWALRVGQYPAR